MRIRTTLLVSALVAGFWFVRSSATVSAASGPPDAPTPQCVATAERPIAICFPEKPLRLRRCPPALRPDFTVDIWHPPETATVGYRLSYQLIVDSVPRDTVDMPSADARSFPYTVTPNLEDAAPLPLPEGTAYALRVTVTPENMPAHTEVSAELSVDRRPRIRGVVVGVSTYANTDYNLNYPAKDAQKFHDVLKRLLDKDFQVELDLRTTDKGSDLEKYSLLRAIAEAGESTDDESRLCDENDWYIFYYSGHGIVTVDQNSSGSTSRYLSTPALNKKRIPHTSIRVGDLADAVFHLSISNVLIVLDSCFSGSHDRSLASGASGAGRGATVITGGRSRRFLNFADGNLSPAPLAESSRRSAGDPTPLLDGDSAVFKQALERHMMNNRHGLVLSASSADREAEEGPVRYELHDRKLIFERASVEANRGKEGHGLYTYSLLANLLALLPRDANIDGLLPNSLTPIGTKCELHFDLASNAAIADIVRLGAASGWNLQTPETLWTKVVPRPLPCTTGGQ